jgi:SAM-dependent methyltransferase
MKYSYDPIHLPWMQDQVWEMKEGIHVYEELSDIEYEKIKSYLPVAPKVVMDIGCGLGRVGIHLNKMYDSPDILYIMADRHGKTRNSGHFNPPEDQYYNDLDLTRDFCKLNGLTNIITFDTEKDDWSTLPEVSLVVSEFALGFHVSIDRYMDRMYEKLATDGTMIFGISPWMTEYTRESFADKFQVAIYDRHPDQKPFPAEDYLILSIKS